MELDKKKILFYQKNRDPFLMIDFVTNYLPGEFCNGYKLLKEDEWFFKVHWPNDPNMPGALQVESLTQMGALNILTLDGNAGKLVYVVAADKIKYKKKIIPNDKLKIETKLISWKRNIGIVKAESFVNGQQACSGLFTMILEDFISK